MPIRIMVHCGMVHYGMVYCSMIFVIHSIMPIRNMVYCSMVYCSMIHGPAHAAARVMSDMVLTSILRRLYASLIHPWGYSDGCIGQIAKHARNTIRLNTIIGTTDV
jgi:hypothetical protein